MEDKTEDNWSSANNKNKIIDLQLRLKAKEERNSYKKDLDTLTSMKQQEKLLQKEAKKTDLAAVSLQNKMIHSDDMRKQLEKSEIQKFLAKQYEFQTNYMKNKKQLEILQKIEEDKKKNLALESQIIKESLNKQEHKKEQLKSEMQILQIRQYEKVLKQHQSDLEKQKELDLLSKRTEQDQLRDRKYKEFYKKIENHQNYLQKLYANLVSPKYSEKDQSLTNWVEKSMEKQYKALQDKDSYERKQKQETINNIKQVWKYQIEEKAERSRLKKEEDVNVYNSIQHQISESRRVDQFREIERKAQQEQYRENLLGQALDASKRKSVSPFSRPPASPSASPENAKKLLRPPFEDIIKARSNSVILAEHYPASHSPAILDRLEKVQSPSSELSFYIMHNPITNPIGGFDPRPALRPLFKPHTLISC